jgi:putative colanic acid biosynthesis acetyltransferase WcaF
MRLWLRRRRRNWPPPQSPPSPTILQTTTHTSPWGLGERIRMLLWEGCWLVFCQWTPKPLHVWRLMWLRLFGAEVDGWAFVHQRARIQKPWLLKLGRDACIGDRANLYNLGPVEIGARAIVAQEAYLCTGTHDFARSDVPLVTEPIRIGEGAFVGARSFILPGMTVGAGAIVGACSVVTKDIESFTVNAGNPSRKLRGVEQASGTTRT